MKMKQTGKVGGSIARFEVTKVPSVSNWVASILATCAASSCSVFSTMLPSVALPLISLPAHASGGQCKWEGGAGAPTYSECKLEDCVEYGGLAQCTAPVIVASQANVPVDAQEFEYGVTTANEYDAGAFCQAEGGTWNGFYGHPECTVSYSPASDSAAVALADAFIAIKFSNASTSLASDSGWSATDGLWGQGTPRYIDGSTILAQAQRNRYYNYGGQSPYLVGMLKTRTASCPSGYAVRTNSQGTWDCWKAPPVQCAASNCGDPVSLPYGEMLQNEVDYNSGGNGVPKVTRYYRSGSYYRPPASTPSPAGLTDYWRWSWQRTLYPLSNPGLSAALQREDGVVIYYDGAGHEILNRDGAAEVLLPQTGGGWQITRANSDVETYNPSGQLTQYKTRAGLITTLTYSASAINIVDSFGHQITYNLNASGQITSTTLPSGSQIQYSYSISGQLSGVTYADSSSRTYWYEDGTNPFLLTGISDELGTRYSTFAYQSGVVSSEVLAGGVYNWSFSASVSSGGGYSLVTDPLNNRRQYNFSNANGVIKEEGVDYCPTCNVPSSATYDSNGNIQQSSDFNGNSTTYQFDETRNLELSRTEASGTALARTTTTQWDTNWRLPDVITEPNRTTTVQYDSSGNAHTKTITDTSAAPNISRSWTYTYNGYGQVLTVDGPRTDVSDITTYTYYTCTTGTQCGQVQTLTNAVGQVTTFNTYNADGQPLTITDPNGMVTTLTYDARQRLISRELGSETTSYGFYPTGLLKQVTLPDSSLLLYTYDGAHRLTKLSDGTGNSISYTLDAMGNRTSETTYDPNNVLSRTHSRAFNNLNQLSQDIGANGSSITTLGYDSNNNQTSSDAPLSRNTATQYDALNRLSQITDPASGVTTFGYDANNNISSVTDPVTLVTNYTHNGFNDLTQQISNSTGTTTNSFDSGGNLAASTDARGAVASYTYDALNRVTSAAYKIGGVTDQTISFSYDTGTNGKGRLVAASDANHAMAWSYDTLGRVTGKAQTVNGVTKSIGYGYANGDMTTVTTPSGQTLSYSYNNHQVTGIAVNSATLLASAVYEPFGPVRGWSWGNNTSEVRLHDTDGNQSQLSGLESTTFTYDAVYRTTGIANSSNTALSWTLGYDSLDRLTSAAQTSTALGWTYDADGNRQQQTGASAGNGLLGASFTYNGRGRLNGATLGISTSYVYNALGQMIEKMVGGATTMLAYDEMGHLIGEYTGAGSLIQETVWLGDLPVATLRPNGTGISIYYIHADQLNAPRMVSRPADNAIMWRWDADPFGSSAPNQNPQSQGVFTYNLRFPGQYYQAETNLNYNYFRDYDPQTGRYLESDPIGLGGGSYSTYSYTNDNPISRSDPSGLQTAPTVPVGPIPLIIPPVAIPGTPENQQFVNAALSAIEEIQAAARKAAQAIHDACTNNDDFCYQRWEAEDQRCGAWRGLGPRAVAACKTRAADRRNLCVGNGGKPHPDEPPEYSPFRDYPR